MVHVGIDDTGGKKMLSTNSPPSCKLTSAQTIGDHAAVNDGGWWEVVDGVFVHKHNHVPTVVPLVKTPTVLKIDI